MRAFLALLLVAAATAELAPLLKNSEPIPGKYIIKIKDSYKLDELTSTVRIFGGGVGAIFRSVVHGFAADLSDDVLDIVRRLPAVQYVEQDGVVRAQVTWGLDRIDQRSLPLDNVYSPMGDGSGKTAYVIDTGVLDTHNDFGGRAHQAVSYANGGNADCNGHGTHCSGTVGSTTYGVAKGINIVGVKVLGCFGSGSTSGVVSGVEWVRDNHVSGQSVASMSLGGGISTTLDNAVNDLVAAGVPTAVAAGNDNSNACNSSPARADLATCVGSTDSSDTRSSFSNYGSCVEIFAPGSSITSTWHTGDDATNTISGTSMACPHVAGGIALYGSSEAMIVAGTSGVLSNVGIGSPNLLLYV